MAYSFYFSTVQGGTLRSLFEFMTNVRVDLSMEVSEQGIRVTTKDKLGQTMVMLSLDATGFEQYSCVGEHRVDMDVTALYRLLKTAASHDTIAMFMRPEQEEYLGIVVSNPEKRVTTEFSLKLQEVDSESIQPLSSVEYAVMVSIPSVFFQRLCRDAQHLSSSLLIEVASDEVRFAVDCDTAAQTTTVRPVVEGKHVVSIRWTKEDDTREPIRGKFELKHLASFCKASALSPHMELFFRRRDQPPHFPLIMQYSVSSLGVLRFVVTNDYR